MHITGSIAETFWCQYMYIVTLRTILCNVTVVNGTQGTCHVLKEPASRERSRLSVQRWDRNLHGRPPFRRCNFWLPIRINASRKFSQISTAPLFCKRGYMEHQLILSNRKERVICFKILLYGSANGISSIRAETADCSHGRRI